MKHLRWLHVSGSLTCLRALISYIHIFHDISMTILRMIYIVMGHYFLGSARVLLAFDRSVIAAGENHRLLGLIKRNLSTKILLYNFYKKS